MGPRMTDPRSAFGRTVRAAREAKGWRQVDLAAALDLDRRAVNRAEMMDEPATYVWPELIDQLADALDLDRDHLYALAGKVPPDVTDYLRGNLPALRRIRQEMDTPIPQRRWGITTTSGID